jgi:CheY-like chemotaxis protein
MGQDTLGNNGKKILVVDDEPLIHDFLSTFLGRYGHAVETANNGLEALHILAEKNFDMVLMDIRMPLMDGLTATQVLRKCEAGDLSSADGYSELAQSLHSRRKGTRIPVVAVTANLDFRETVLQAGMDELILKPFNFENILSTINQYCSKQEAGRDVERRRHIRHAAGGGILFINNGCRSKVLNISYGGLAVQCTNQDAGPGDWQGNVLDQARNISIERLRLKVVRREEVPSPKSADAALLTIGAVFDHPDAGQQSQLRRFLEEMP